MPKAEFKQAQFIKKQHIPIQSAPKVIIDED